MWCPRSQQKCEMCYNTQTNDSLQQSCGININWKFLQLTLFQLLVSHTSTSNSNDLSENFSVKLIHHSKVPIYVQRRSWSSVTRVRGDSATETSLSGMSRSSHTVYNWTLRRWATQIYISSQHHQHPHQQLKLIDRLRATRWTHPDYWQTDNSNGLVMVIRNYHWLNSASRVLISTCSAPLVQTGQSKQFSLLDLNLWPTTMIYNSRLAKVKVDPHAKNQGQRSNGSNGRVP